MTRIESMHDDQPDEGLLDRVRETLEGDGLVAIPTETVYGLAANAWSSAAVAKIFKAKGRPENNPLIVHVASVDRLSEAVAMPLSARIQKQLDALLDLWPGPLSLVLPRSIKIPDCVTAGRETVAVRIPSHPIAQAILQRCPFPIAAPSANPSKYVSPTTAQHCADGLGDIVDLIVDGGPCDVGVESTIVSLCGEQPRLLRPGYITAEEIADRLKVPVASLQMPASEGNAVLLAPGMMREHYCPRTPLTRVSELNQKMLCKRVGRIAFAPLSESEAAKYAVVEVLSADVNLQEVAKGLFAAFRRLDQQGLDYIVVDECANDGVGRAIMDRVMRAAARRDDR
ncbi:MAG: L-threonylcarbamoyladenylate synthase [Pirellulaceae bacterium]